MNTLVGTDKILFDYARKIFLPQTYYFSCVEAIISCLLACDLVPNFAISFLPKTKTIMKKVFLKRLHLSLLIDYLQAPFAVLKDVHALALSISDPYAVSSEYTSIGQIVKSDVVDICCNLNG